MTTDALPDVSQVAIVVFIEDILIRRFRVVPVQMKIAQMPLRHLIRAIPPVDVGHLDQLWFPVSIEAEILHFQTLIVLLDS